jgi:hypothetical protein
LGSASGVRVVVGWWHDSPLGEFVDAMVERADGHRVLLAPNRAVAEFVSSTYVFDETRIEPITAREVGSAWVVGSGSLSLELTVGPRMPLGWLLRCVPVALATRPWFTHLTDPVARVALRGVRTRGVAREGRQEFYAATDLHRVTASGGSFDGVPLGALGPVWPACRFGFSSTPRVPSVTSVTTTVRTA